MLQPSKLTKRVRVPYSAPICRLVEAYHPTSARYDRPFGVLEPVRVALDWIATRRHSIASFGYWLGRLPFKQEKGDRNPYEAPIHSRFV